LFFTYIVVQLWLHRCLVSTQPDYDLTSQRPSPDADSLEAAVVDVWRTL